MKLLIFILVTAIFILGGIGLFLFYSGSPYLEQLGLVTPESLDLEMEQAIGDNWIIDGDRIYVDDENASISITPHTLIQSGELLINLTSKVYEGDVDIVFGVDSDTIKPRDVWIFLPHQVNTSRSFTCPTGVFNYTITPTKHAWCWLNESIVDGSNNTIGEKHTLYFEHDFESGDIPSQTIYWNDSEIVDWKRVTGGVQKLDYEFGGMNKWFYVKNVPIQANRSYLARARIMVLPKHSAGGKYWFAIKPSGETIPEAIANKHFYAIDPWWNSTFARKKELNITGGSASLTDFTAHVKVDYDTDMQLDYDDLAFVDSTETTLLTHEVAFSNTTQADVWIRIPTLATGINTIYMYYNNSEVTSSSNIYDTWDDSTLVVLHLDEPDNTEYMLDSKNADDNGTFFGTRDMKSGIIGNAAFIDSTGDLINVNDTAALSNLSNFTASWWVNYSGGFGSFTRTVGKGVGTIPSVEWMLYKEADDHMDFFMYTSGGITTGYEPTNHQWVMATVGHNDSGMFFYLNDTLIGVLSAPNLIRDTPICIMLGARWNSVTDCNNGIIEGMIGELDEFMYWNESLSSAEIIRNYQNADSSTWSFGDERILDSEPPSVILNTPLNLTFDLRNIVFNVTATDNSEVASCNYSLDSGDNVTMAQSGTSWADTNSSMLKGSHTAQFFCEDGTGNLNDSVTVTFFLTTNVSVENTEIEVAEILFDSESYIVISNSSFDLASPDNLTVKGVGQVSKFTTAASSTLSLRATLNGVVLFDEEVRTVSGLDDRGVFNIPINGTDGVYGTNTLVIEASNDGSGSLNLSSLELFIDSDRAGENLSMEHILGEYDGTFSSTDFLNLANFTIDKGVHNSSTMVDIQHTFMTSNPDTTPNCYLENNATIERTPMYTRWLENSQDTGSAGMNYLSKIETNFTETWELWCASSDTDTITNNVTAYLFELRDEFGNIIEGFQNETTILRNASGSNFLIATYDSYVIQNGTAIELLATAVIQSTTGAQISTNSPRIYVNSTTLAEANCLHSYYRSLDSSNDIGTVKIYVNCDGIAAGETHTFNIYIDVVAGEAIDVLNASISGYEIEEATVTAEVVPPAVIIINPSPNETVGGIESTININVTVTDFSNTGWISNVSLLNLDETLNVSISDESTYANTTGTTFDTTTVPDDTYLIDWNVRNGVGNDFDRINITIDNTPPTFDNLRNFIHQLNTSFGESITASDPSGIDSYRLNDTSIISIAAATGLMANATNLSTEHLFYLNITANDTLHNLISGVFNINVTISAFPRLRIFPNLNQSVPYVRLREHLIFP
jgi:hypothetical protein